VNEIAAEKVAGVNDTLLALSREILPVHMRLAYLHVDSLREQEVNARSMSKAMFSQLAENTRAAGALESTPFCAEIDGVMWIVSGHHRVRAARAAGCAYVLALVASGLSWDQVRAKQLAHNNISGQDDPELVRRIFEQIRDIQARFETYIDPKLFDAAPKPMSFTQVDIDFQKTSKAVLLLLLPTQWAQMEAALEAILPKSEADAALICGFAEWEPWALALRRVRKELEITAVPTAVARMAQLAMERLDELAQAVNPCPDSPQSVAADGHSGAA